MVKVSAIFRINEILTAIEKQAKQLDLANESLPAHRSIAEQSLFAVTLFTTVSDKYFDYVKETRRKTNSLEKLLQAKQTELASALLSQIEQQILSLKTALQANTALHANSQYQLNKRHYKKQHYSQQADRYKKATQAIIQPSQNLYQKLAEHHEFERRLATMIAEREYKRTDSNHKNSQVITQEILKLHQRLGRCRQAISQIEREIELLEKDN
jgi:primosomal replication protein N''